MKSDLDAAGRERLLAQLIAGKFPDAQGRYGPFGGRYVPETLVPAHERLEEGVKPWLGGAQFHAAVQQGLRTSVGRPTALSHAAQLLRRQRGHISVQRP